MTEEKFLSQLEQGLKSLNEEERSVSIVARLH
ncbi:hypothetical protein UACE39S_03447 [Ureibacillus acetophenoni]